MVATGLNNALIWQKTELRRSAHEKKWEILVRRSLNSQLSELAGRINEFNYKGDFEVKGEILKDTIVKLYQSVGNDFARRQYSKCSQSEILHKQEDSWMEYMRDYAETKAGKRINSMNAYGTAQAKKSIQKSILQSVEEGLGALETARNIRQGLETLGKEMNTWRALRIARTEIMTASNIGAYVGARDSGYPMAKYWIPTYDGRTRDTHMVMEKQNPKMMDEAFLVGGIPAECPGDPDLPPEEVINCRCTIAFEVIM